MSGDQFDADRRGRFQTGAGPWYGPGPRPWPSEPGEMVEFTGRPPTSPDATSPTVMETIHADICALAARANLSVERIEWAANRMFGSEPVTQKTSDQQAVDVQCVSRSIQSDLDYLSLIVTRLETAADRIERIV